MRRLPDNARVIAVLTPWELRTTVLAVRIAADGSGIPSLLQLALVWEGFERGVRPYRETGEPR